MDTASYLARLYALRIERADAALASSAGAHPEFEFGRHVGFNQGLRSAEQLIAEIIDEEREGDT